jgi:uncharacterized membrane protein YeaQ/YmgE (transglycosylase-associated protein family)
MSLLELLLLLVIAGVCGSIGKALAGSSRGGLVVTIVLGFVGAWLGSWLAGSLGLPMPLVVRIDDASFPLLWSVIGSALFVAVITMMTRGGR